MGLFSDWKKSRVGTGYRIDLDNQSYDCVDVPKDWAEFIFKKSWKDVYCWGNAKDHWANIEPRIGKYWSRQSSPAIGDVVCMSGAIGGGYGHVAVVIDLDGNDIIVAQQNTFTQQAIYTGRFSARASYIQGYLRPIADIGDAKVELQPYQRVVASGGVHHRDEPTSNSNSRAVFSAGEIANFKGWVRGQKVDGNDVWLVGRLTGGYCWSGGFTDTSTNGLEDMNPKSLTPTQRQVAEDVMNVRRTPLVAPDNVAKTFNPAQIVDMSGYVRGQNIDGVDVWFKTTDGLYVWSKGFTNTTTDNLPDLTPRPPATPTTPTTPEPTPVSNALPLDVVVNKKNPITPLDYKPNELVTVGGQYMEATAGRALADMVKASGGILIPASGFRSYQTQQQVYNGWVAKDGQEKADTYSARAGHSEHQTGYTIDFSPIDDAFKNTTAYDWLVNNAYKFGYIERYQTGQENVTGYVAEPWHWRYVGVAIATQMRTAGAKTMEQYLGVAGGLYPDQEPTTPTPPAEPTEPTTPTEPTAPAPPPEAVKSASLFVARIATQLATAKLIVEGLIALSTSYSLGLVITDQAEGWLTVVTALVIIFVAQFGYKLKAKFKWLF